MKNSREMFCEKLLVDKENIDLILADTINHLKKLISFKSYSEEEGEIIGYIEDMVSNLISIYGDKNVKVERIGNSYLVEFDFDREETLMLVGHVDIVNEGDKNNWNSPPFDLQMIPGEGETNYERNINGKLVGRGSVDMKGFDALMLSMIKKMFMEESKYNIKFLFYDKEEIANSGVEEMYKNGKLQEIVEDVNFTIVGEPTDTKIDNEVSTFLGGNIIINGEGGHSSQIAIEDTVYSQLNSLIGRVIDLQDKYKEEIILNLTRIEADNGSNNTIPSELKVGLNLRSNMNISTEEIRKVILREIIGELDFEETVFDEGGLCEKSIISKYIENIPTNSAAYWSDIAILNKLTPAVNWGPGSIKQAHTYNETLLVKDLRDYISNMEKLLF